MQLLLSIVVPVYNVEAYLNQCLDSLCPTEEQLIGRYEVLVINDGTPDHSAEIAKTYQIRYPSIFRVIDKENGGHGSAWNRGMDEARGKYIAFLDSDDWYSEEALKRLLEFLSSIDTDAVVTKNIVQVFKDGEHLYSKIQYDEELNTLPEDKLVDASEFDFSILSPGVWSFQHVIWDREKLLRTGVRCLEKTSYDDDIIQIAGLSMMRNFYYLNLVLYNYRVGRTGQSIGGGYTKKRVSQYYQTALQQYEFAEGENRWAITPSNIRMMIERSIAQSTFLLYHHMAQLPYREYASFRTSMITDFGRFRLYEKILDSGHSMYRENAFVFYNRIFWKRIYGEAWNWFALSFPGRHLRRLKHYFSR